MECAKDLKVGSLAHGEFLVLKSSVKQTKSGKNYLDLDLRALDGTVFNGCKRWDYSKPVDGVIDIQGTVESFNDNIQINIRSWEPGTKCANDFQTKCPWDIGLEFLHIRFDRMMSCIDDENIAWLVKKMIDYWSETSFLSFDKRDSNKEFFEHSGAQRNHHCYRYGLLEHTVEVMEHAMNIADTHGITEHEADLLIAGCALHDIGKLDEFHLVNGVYQFSDIGKAYGWTSNAHLYIGSQMLTIYHAFNKKVSVEDVTVIQNIVMSHHGDFGDVKPKYIVSMIAHMADNASAQVNRMKMNLINSANGEVDHDSTRQSYLSVKEP
jgi:3'-5' exoribonuclease